MNTGATTMTLRIELDRGYGFQVRGEGPIPAGASREVIEREARGSALNGPVRAYVDGVLVFECKKLTKKQAIAHFGLDG